ncbi:methyltransferase, FxLD system [Actinomadura sp. SCN-SB]|uniref:methyltransferase, FxLD system n=1 Tax=Actinomadura sp. SCN-SB TaxID=3373092 RepID=UPI003752F1D9
MNNDTVATPSPADLRERLVEDLISDGVIATDSIAEAFRAVPRHVFAPDASLEEAYARDIVVVKRNEYGTPISTVSAPEIQAGQLEQAQITPGMRVLEIGSGGYNAALIAELVGAQGHVTTVDIDPDVTDRARSFLNEAGYDRVNVLLADAEGGVPEHAPYDRIIVTVGAWDIPPAWTEQLAKDGRLVVPLRMRGVTRSLALEREGDHLVSRSAHVCGFVKMQGAGAHDERLWLLRGEQVGLRFDDGTLQEPSLLDGVLSTEPAAAWSGVLVGRTEPFATLPLWLATTLPGFCGLAVDTSQGQPGLAVEEGGRWFPYAMVDGDSFAYLSTRPAEPGTVEFGAHAYGPRAREVAAVLAEQVRRWDRDHRSGPEPDITVWPISAPLDHLPEGAVISKKHRHITISWPSP